MNKKAISIEEKALRENLLLQFTSQPQGTILRNNIAFTETDEPLRDGFAVVTDNIEAHVAIQSYERLIAPGQETTGWRRFLCQDGLSFVHHDFTEVYKLQRQLDIEINRQLAEAKDPTE